MDILDSNHSIIANHKGDSYFYKPCLQFDAFGLPRQFQDCAHILNIEKPTIVQSYAIPLIMEKKNVFVKAETGSGKTLAFLMPILFNLSQQLSLMVDERKDNLCHPYTIIVAPTRELAMQIHRLCYRLKKIFPFVKCCLVVGGIKKDEQVKEMLEKNANIVISTPGRVLDLMNLQTPHSPQEGEEEEQGTQYLSLDRIQYIVVDEADRMLDLGFKEQLNLMFSSLVSNSYQIVCCSATFTDKIRDSVDRWCPDRYEIEIPNNSIIVNTDSEVSINPNITQDVQLCSEHKKIRKLFDFIRYVQEQDEKNHVRQKSIALIFVNKMKTGDYILKFVRENWAKGPSGKQKQGRLKPLPKKSDKPIVEKPSEEKEEEDEEDEQSVKNLRIDFLNSKMAQPVREKVLNSFRSGKIQFLITTDIVNRGIDIPNLNYVLNYDFPTNLVTYVHRIGRTGRNNTPGYSRSFITRNMSPLVPDLVLLLQANQQKVPKLLADLAEEQKRLVEFGKWENEVDAAMQEGKSVEEIAKELQPSQLENVEGKEEEKVEEKTEEKVFVPKPAVDAEGKVISLDSNWKSFLVKKGKNPESKQKKGKITVKKEKKVEIKNKTVEKKEQSVEKQTKNFFDFHKEKSMKKVPLVKKVKK